MDDGSLGVVVLLALAATAPANGTCGSSESGNVPNEVLDHVVLRAGALDR